MKTTITISDIAVSCVFGVSEKERSQKQTILISVELVVDAENASQTDAFSDVLVDYKKVYDTIIFITEKTQFHLLEKLVKTLLDTFLATKGVVKASVTATKPTRLPHAKGVSISMRGEKSE